MKKKIVTSILVLTMTAALGTGCSKSADSTNTESTANTESTTDTGSQKGEKASDNDQYANDLPVGCIGEDGYYNSYYGFKMVPSVEEKEQKYYGGEIMEQFTCADAELDGDYTGEELQKALEEKVDSSEGNANRVYLGSQIPTNDGETTFTCMVCVTKLTEEITAEEEATSAADDMISSGYVLEEDLEQGKIQLGGEERNYVKIKKYNGNDVDRMSIFSVKDGYECSIVISDTTDFDAACAVFEEF